MVKKSKAPSFFAHFLLQSQHHARLVIARTDQLQAFERRIAGTDAGDVLELAANLVFEVATGYGKKE